MRRMNWDWWTYQAQPVCIVQRLVEILEDEHKRDKAAKAAADHKAARQR
jgi:hypothetical protein